MAHEIVTKLLNPYRFYGALIVNVLLLLLGSAFFLVPPLTKYVQSIVPGFGAAGPFAYVLMGIGTLLYLVVIGYLIQFVAQSLKEVHVEYHGMSAIMTGLKTAIVLTIYYIPYSLLNVFLNTPIPQIVYAIAVAVLLPAIVIKLATEKNPLQAFNFVDMFSLFSVRYFAALGVALGAFMLYSLVSYGVGIGVLTVLAGNTAGAAVYYVQYIVFLTLALTTVASIISYAVSGPKPSLPKYQKGKAN